MESTRVDPSALHAAAQQLDDAAELLQNALGRYLRAVHFHADAGVRSALEHLVSDVTHWQRTAGEIAAALRTCAQRYIDAETGAARSLR